AAGAAGAVVAPAAGGAAAGAAGLAASAGLGASVGFAAGAEFAGAAGAGGWLQGASSAPENPTSVGVRNRLRLVLRADSVRASSILVYSSPRSVASTTMVGSLPEVAFSGLVPKQTASSGKGLPREPSVPRVSASRTRPSRTSGDGSG